MALDVDAAISWLSERPSVTGIFTDFDGTMAPIVDRPSDATPIAGAPEAMQRLAERYAVVGVVSGRSLEDLRSRFAPPGVILAGAYGRERSDRPQRRVTEGWETVAVAARAAVAGLDGVVLERKGAGVALHYRQAPELRDDVDVIATTLAAEFELDVRPGRLVYELVTPGPGKGEAIVALIAEHGLQRACFAGDDVADAEAFALLAKLDVEVVRIAVASEESPPELEAASDLVVEGPAELVGLLQRLAG